MITRHVLSLFAGAMVFMAFGAGTARAFEGQARIGASFGYSYFSPPDTTTHGFAGGVHGILGIDDTQALTVELNAGYHPGTGIFSAAGGFGAYYFLDYFQAIPYFGAITELATVRRLNGGCDLPEGPPCSTSGIGFSIPFGLDYMLSRRWVVGLQGRYHLMALGSADTHQWFTTTVRAEFMFPY